MINISNALRDHDIWMYLQYNHLEFETNHDCWHLHEKYYALVILSDTLRGDTSSHFNRTIMFV